MSSPPLDAWLKRSSCQRYNAFAPSRYSTTPAEAGIGLEVAHSDPSGVLVLAKAPGQPFAEHLSTAQALPDHAEQIDRLASLITELASRFPTGDLVPTHGDAYEANIFWHDPEVTFIDVNRAGPGCRVDDLACILAHLAVLPQLSPAHYPRGNEVLESWHRELARRVGPGALGVRVAGVLLSLVGGAPRETALHRPTWFAAGCCEPGSSTDTLWA